MAKRRPQGDGMVRKRSDGRWEARIVIGHKNDGTPMHKSVFDKTQKETLDTYTHVTGDMQKNAAAIVGGMVKKLKLEDE